MSLLKYAFVSTFCLSGNLMTAQQFLLKADTFDEPRVLEYTVNEVLPRLDTTPVLNVTLEIEEQEISVLHLNRSSDTVIILGQGLPATKEEMLRYAECLNEYDIIMFDYRWANTYELFLTKALLNCAPVQRVLLDEEAVVRAVLSYVKQDTYQKVVGLGVCYSNFLFAKIQADDVASHGHGPFTHLVLDSCWYSLKCFAESIATDPYLPTSPQYGGAPALLKAFTQSRVGKYLATKLAFYFLTNVSIKNYLGRLKCPVLFIYGQKDLMVSPNQFDLIWKAAQPHQRVAFVTPAPHAGSIGYPAMYTRVVEQFIASNTIAEFLEVCR